MRSICGVVAVAALVASANASADVSKAWAAAKDNLPDTIPAIVAVDVAALAKLPAGGKLVELFLKSDRDVEEVFGLIKSTCNTDATAAISGFVIAGDPNANDDDVVLIFQLTMDRPKASTCIESMLRQAEKKKQVVVQQTGIFTEVSVGGDPAYFAWLDKNVVAFNLDPNKKARLEKSIGKKGAFAKSPAGSLLGKLDPKGVAFGAIKLPKQLDRDLPVVSAYGNAALSGNTLSGALVGTATDATSATKFADEAKREMARALDKNRTPAPLKKLIKAITVSATGADITVRGSANANDIFDAFEALVMRKAPEPPPPAAP